MNEAVVDLDEVVPKPPPEMYEFFDRLKADRRITEKALNQAIAIASGGLKSFYDIPLVEQEQIQRHAKCCGLKLYKTRP